MSNSMFEIRRVFQQQRPEIGKCNDVPYSIANAVKEFGPDQLMDNLNHMFAKEAGVKARDGINLQHNPVDFLQDNFGGKITPQVREESVLSILQFAVQTKCQDQTVLQAVHLADNYLKFNQSCQPAFMRIIYAMALEISIKLNEQMVLSLEDIESLFENRFNQNMLVNLERHILSLNNWRVNAATPLDFVLNFVYLEQALLNSGTFVLPPEQLVNDTLYLLHYALSQYNLSRTKYSSLAIAAICLVLQDAHDDMQQESMQQDGPDVDQYGNQFVSPMQQLRDTFLDAVIRRFPQLDLDEIQEILIELKKPFVVLAQQSGQEDSVTEPWPFNRIGVNNQAANVQMNRESSFRDELQIVMEESLPDMQRLSLEDKHKRAGQAETDGDMIFSSSAGASSLQGSIGDQPKQNTTSSSMGGGAEESKSAGAGKMQRRTGADPHMVPSEYPPPVLGRASLSESTGPPQKIFVGKPDQNSAHTKGNSRHGGDNENLLDDEPEEQAFLNASMSSTKTFHGGGVAMAKQVSVSGLDEDDSDEELTYNSQGKSIRRVEKGAADKTSLAASRRKTITKLKPEKRMKRENSGKVQKKA